MLNFRDISFYNNYEMITELMRTRLLKNEHICPKCNHPCNLVKYKRNKDGYAWRCNFKLCANFKNYYSIREGSFFKGFDTSLKTIIQIVADVGTRRPRLSIYESKKDEIHLNTLDRILNKLKGCAP